MVMDALWAIKAVASVLGLPTDTPPCDVVESVRILRDQHERLHRAARAWAPPDGFSRASDIATVPAETVAADLRRIGWEEYHATLHGSNWRHQDSVTTPLFLPASSADVGYHTRVEECVRAVARFTSVSPVDVLARWLPPVTDEIPTRG